MTKSKVLVLLVFVTGITFSAVGTSGSDAQSTTDNATDTTMAMQNNMTASAGNMTDANVTQSGKISGCGTECF
jgi:type IV secretory pathway TrbL component